LVLNENRNKDIDFVRNMFSFNEENTM